jgi:Fe-S-cluster containining protein
MEKAPLQFRILDSLIRVDAPPERARLDEILPALWALDDGFAAAAIRQNGRPVSCAKGCSACCRIQAVPVTPVEAYALLLLVERLPEPRRTAILTRFAASVARLHAAGLAEGFLEGRRPVSEEDAKAQARQYLDLGLICPFLDHDVCSIYQARPFACREYFVTSANELCVDPLLHPVKTVPAISDGGEANLATAAAFTGRPGYTIPLTLALIYATTHREELERTYDGNQIFTRALGDLFGTVTRELPLGGEPEGPFL